MNIVKGVYVLSEKEKERRLANHKTQLKKIANRRNSFQLIELQNNNSKSNETSSKLSLDSIAKSNKIILNRINNTTTATNKMPAVNYDYLSLKKLNVTLEGGRKYRIKLANRRNRSFLDKLKSVRPYYNSHEWERDDEKRKNMLKVMRKVKYKRLDQASMAAPHEDKSGEETVPTKSVDILTNSQDLEKSDSANFEVDTKSTGFSIGNQSSEVDSDQRLQPIEQTFANLSI